MRLVKIKILHLTLTRYTTENLHLFYHWRSAYALAYKQMLIYLRHIVALQYKQMLIYLRHIVAVQHAWSR